MFNRCVLVSRELHTQQTSFICFLGSSHRRVEESISTISGRPIVSRKVSVYTTFPVTNILNMARISNITTISQIDHPSFPAMGRKFLFFLYNFLLKYIYIYIYLYVCAKNQYPKHNTWHKIRITWLHNEICTETHKHNLNN